MNASQVLSFIFLFFLSAAKCQFLSESAENPEEKYHQFHIDEHKNTIEILKSEVGQYFTKLMKTNSEILTKLETLNERIVQMEMNQKEHSAEFLLLSKEHIKTVSLNLTDSFNKGLAQSDLKTEASLQSLYESFTQKLLTTELKMEESFANLSGLLTGELRRTELKEDTSLQNISALPSKTVCTVESPQNPRAFTTTEVEEVNAKEGVIAFVGGSNAALRRKIWVFQSEGGTAFRGMSFLLQENGLGVNARLSLWGSGYDSGNQQVWNGSQSGWIKEKESAGNMILLTLTFSPSAEEQPSFKLKFNTSQTSDYFNCSSEVVSWEGRQVVSFPKKNSLDLRFKDYFAAVIAPPTGNSFGLTLKYMDVSNTSSNSCSNYFYVWFFDESSTGYHYERLPLSAYRRCGRVGEVSEPIGNSIVAILLFYVPSESESFGRGLRLEVN